jgi:hypothetical protein
MVGGRVVRGCVEATQYAHPDVKKSRPLLSLLFLLFYWHIPPPTPTPPTPPTPTMSGDAGLPAWLLQPLLISPQVLSLEEEGEEEGGHEGAQQDAQLLAALPLAIRANLPFPSLFPVQRALLSLLHSHAAAAAGVTAAATTGPPTRVHPPRDICVSAPTGKSDASSSSSSSCPSDASCNYAHAHAHAIQRTNAPQDPARR